MAMVANNPKAAKRLGISQSVGQEFMKADKRKVKKFDEGGETKFASQFKPGRTDEGATVVKKSSGSARTTTDEERYGKIGAQIRRLDPEAFKNRTDRSAAANLKLLRELREKKAGAPAKVVETKTETKVEAPLLHAAHLSHLVLEHRLRSALLLHERHFLLHHSLGLFHLNLLLIR